MQGGRKLIVRTLGVAAVAVTVVAAVTIGVLTVGSTPRATGALLSSATATTTTTVPTTPTTTTTVPTTTTTVPTTTTTVPTTTTTVPTTWLWPSGVSSAIMIPQLSVSATSAYQPRVAIASLTKLMTTWVILHRLPLAYSQRGPCLTVSVNDVAAYRYDVATDQSNAAIALGERLCEGQLLRGLLVHSAGDYAALLVEMTGLSTATFVRLMNRDAKILGLDQTHYGDITGIGSQDLSTAHDQAVMAVDLMAAEPIVRQIVALPRVALPVAGVLWSYTPFVGQGGVVGGKSGFTGLAGGCDVMAINFRVGAHVVTTYSVVLGDHGSNPIVGAGEDALALARAVRPLLRVARTSTGSTVEWTGSRDYLVASSRR